MKILKIRILNINSLQSEIEIDFTKSPILETGLFAITGDTGSGKTTILDAITLALYGKVHRNKEVKEVLSYGATQCHAEIEFSDKNTIYRSKWSIWRARGKADGNILGPTREFSEFNPTTHEFDLFSSKKNDIDTKIESITGLDYARFTRSVLLSQGDFAAFLKASEKDRSDLLERITGTEIYSEISIAAYQRYKEEKEQLSALTMQQEVLQLLPQERLDEIALEQTELETQSAALKTEIEQLRTQVARLERIQQLEKKARTLLRQQEMLQAQTETSQYDLGLLQKHEQTLPFRKELTQFQDRLGEEQRLVAEVSRSAATIGALAQNETASQQLFVEQKEHLKTEKQKSQDLEKILSKVQKLDIQIAEQETPFLEMKKAVEHSTKEQTDLQTQIETKTNLLADKKSALETTQSWIVTNKKLAHYKELSPKIELQREQLRAIFIEKRQALEQLQSLLKDEAQKQKHQEKATRSLADLKNRETELLEEFKLLAPDNFVQTRSELLQKLNSEIDTLDDENKNLQHLKLLTKEYMKALQRQSEEQERLHHLQQEEIALGMRILTNSELIDELGLRVTYKKGILDQQKLIANYDRDREELSDGEPCPLCFSEAHPFRTHHIKPFVNEAQAEFNAVQAQYDAMRADYLNLMNQHRDLMARIQHLSGDTDNNLEGQLQANLQLLQGMEEKIAAFAPEIKSEHYSITKEGILIRKIGEFEIEIQERKKAQERLIYIDKTLGLQEKQLANLQAQVQEANYQVRSLTDNKTRLEAEIADLTKQFDKNTAALNQSLKKLGYAFEGIEKAGVMFVQLEKEGQQYDVFQNKRTELNQLIALQTQAITSEQKQFDKNEKTLGKQQVALDKAAQKIAFLKEKRHDLFGDKNPKQERQHQTDLLRKVEKQLETSRLAMEKAVVALKTQKTSLAEQEKNLQQIQQQKVRLQLALDGKIATSIFNNLEDLQQAILEDARVDIIKNQRKKLEQETIELAQAIRTNTEELTQEKAAQTPDIVPDEIRQNLTDKETNQSAIQQALGSLLEQIKQDQTKRKEANQLIEAIENQAIKLRRWAKLNDIIGQADGQKFRKFAQGLTLQNLVIYANQHLRQLNGRYRIHKPADQDLYLEIVDAFQADNRRSMLTLSGGESFLVSLALALALSDMASSRTNIQSLFIDEGFGTLDEQTLDMAITTLENLQAQGKTIGVISHVKALKERIGTQIQVHKSGSGRSVVEIIG